jgi:flagellar biosynthetic protein FlhB
MADSQDSDAEKTEEPSGRKLEQAKEEGNVSRSAEVSSTLLLIVAFISLFVMGPWMYETSKHLFVEFFLAMEQPVFNVEQAQYFAGRALLATIVLAAPIITMMLLTGVAASVLQTGVVFSTKVIGFKTNRINPINGLKRIFSMKGFVELAKGVSKIFIVSIVIYNTVSGDIEEFLNLCVMPLNTIVLKTGNWLGLLVSRMLSALLLLSILDAAYQRYQYKKDLRMTKQEVKDEYKQMEGDPQVKGSRKRLAMQRIRKRRLDHAVLNSDVVVTNPTHFAVALRYDPEKHAAPVIMAKGTRLRALKIREFAQKYDIPIIENKPVARALFASGEEEQPIPPELYQAVAEILAVVFRQKGKGGKAA